jgi:hypothetical protein
MLPDDTFHTRLAETMASLRAWTGFVADVAAIEDAEIGGSWHFGLSPHMQKACPVELLIRLDQRFDLTVAGEGYEDRPIQSFDLFLPLVQAIADGQVVTRHSVSRLTGLVHATSTVVRLDGGGVFEAGHPSPDAPALPGAPLEWRDVHYLPYRR